MKIWYTPQNLIWHWILAKTQTTNFQPRPRLYTISQRPGRTKITEVINDSNLAYTVSLPTRDSNILDLFFTTNPTFVQRVSILPGISDHDIVQIQVNTSAKNLFQKPRSISLYKKANWDGIKQALEAYHQDMLESGKYSSLNAVQLWDDLHSTLTSLTNKCIPSKLSSTRNNLPWVNQKLKRIAIQRDRAFQKHRKSGKPADRKVSWPQAPIQKVHQTFLPILPWGYSWCGLKWSYLHTQYKKTL